MRLLQQSPCLLSRQRSQSHHRYSSIHGSISLDSSVERPIVVVNSGLSNNAIPRVSYIRGWAWQTALLQQRLLYKRHRQQQHVSITGTLDLSEPTPPNVILVLEHEPVYTLGRGATVNHVSCFADARPTTLHRTGRNVESSSSSCSFEESRRRLDRSYRGWDAARLTADTKRLEQCLLGLPLNDTVTACLTNQSYIYRKDGIARPMTSLMHQSPPPQFSHHSPSVWEAVEWMASNIEQEQRKTPPVTTPPSPSPPYSEIVPVYRMERGGEVTFHGPGQLVVYPIWDLASHPFQTDLHWYLRCLEQAVIDTIMELCETHNNSTSCIGPSVDSGIGGQQYGNGTRRTRIQAHRDTKYTGVWINETAKIAAIGVAASRWITTHGIALNVTTDLSYFDRIVPCGIAAASSNDDNDVSSHRTVTSLQALGIDTTVSAVGDVLLKHLARVFSIDLIPGELIQ